MVSVYVVLLGAEKMGLAAMFTAFKGSLTWVFIQVQF